MSVKKIVVRYQHNTSYMPFACTRPYPKGTDDILLRAKSCSSAESGAYANRQTCVEQCYVDDSPPPTSFTDAVKKGTPGFRKKKTSSPRRRRTSNASSTRRRRRSRSSRRRAAGCGRGTVRSRNSGKCVKKCTSRQRRHPRTGRCVLR